MTKTSAVLFAVACTLCVEWVRFAGTVKSVDLKTSTVTVQNKEGDLFRVPVDYQVTIRDKRGEVVTLKTLTLDQRVVLTYLSALPPRDDSEGLAPQEPPSHGL